MEVVLLHTPRNDALAETYVHEPGGTCPVLRATADGDVRFILPDQNDAPSEEVGAGGELAWTARKATWGEGFGAVGASGGEPALGQWYDAESGLHYNFFRYYDPESGRYLSTDPIDLEGGFNGYLTTSDPLVQYDRFGQSRAECEGATGRLPQFLRNKLKRIKNEMAAGGPRGVSGAVSREEAHQLGEAWAGPGHRVTSQGGLVSEDGLRQFRPPFEKRGINPTTNEPWSRTGMQSNFESRTTPEGPWPSNVHLDVNP